MLTVSLYTILDYNKSRFHKQIKEIGRNIHHEKRLVQTLNDLLKQKNFLKYADKFEVKFHLHFDGEFKIRKGELEGTGETQLFCDR